tara:strand:- start:2341 stop:2796 length:456 start_codon:yes stop_codon:yes gene_type:complete
MNTKGEYKITRYYGNGSFAAPFQHIKQSETAYIDGKRDGLSKFWDENGQLLSQAEYWNDNLDGLLRQWYDNGQLKTELNYKGGDLVGVVRTWNKDGSGDLEYTASYKDEKRNSIKINWEDKTTTLSCEMCGEVMTKDDHDYCDICPDCLEG